MAGLRVLFIGNSFTARNDVPGLIAAMASGRDHKFTSRLINRGGASLKMHFQAGQALQAIATGKFDAVVLQEQSTLPVKNAARFQENVRLFAGPIRAAGARIVLYLTWARRHAPESQAALTDGYTAIGREVGAAVAPAGVAWQLCLGANPGIILHDKDGSHPTLAGSYLAACTLFATLFGDTPVGAAAPDGLPADQVKALQNAAQAAMKR